MKITKKCINCNTPYTVEVIASSWAKWQSGALIQDAMSQLSTSDREFLISTICPVCQDEIFISIEEENDERA